MAQIETRSRAENEVSLMLLGCNTASAVISGGPIQDFTIGWALRGGFNFSNKAHYYRAGRVVASLNPTTFEMKAIAACGVHAELNLMLGAGNFPRCKHCQKIERR